MSVNETDSKVPIHRLPNERTLQDRGIRTIRACDGCRQRKWKCDGKKPMCTRCQSLGLAACVYSESKRFVERKKLDSSLFKVGVYEELLRDISRNVDVDAPLASRIARALEGRLPDPTTDEHPDSPSSDSTSSIGSLRDMDCVNEDLNRSEASRATGYIGKNSEVAWMQRLVSEATKQESALRDQQDYQQHRLPVDDSIASANYHLDDDRLFEPDVKDIFSLPPKVLADQLLHIYLAHVHFSLPIIRQNLFIKQYNRVFSGHLLNPGRKWLAVLNMIFAIGSQLHRLSQRVATNDDDEKMFFARAKSLNISENVLYDHADLQQIQAEALMAFYLLNLSQINRSWKMIGIAIRSAIALGLNLRIGDTKMDLEANEARKRLWWSIFYLEHILSVMTGRVSYLGDGCCVVGPPLPLVNLDCLVPDLGKSEHDAPAQAYDIQWSIHLQHEKLLHQQMLLKATEANASTYFFYLVDLISIAQAFTNRVYSAGALQEGWAQTESRISLYNKMMDQWVSGLHPSFAFEEPLGSSLSATGSHGQVSLALHYYSARILLNRPCLSRPEIDQKSGTRFPRSRFSNDASLTCLRASLALITVLPNQPDMYWAHNVAPQWCLLHFLMQSTTVLLLQLSIGPVPVRVPKGATAEISAGSPGTNESPDIVLASVKKALCWLQCLGMTDASARRAFELCNSSVRRIALGKGLDLAGVPYSTAQALSSGYKSQKQQPTLSDGTTGLPSLQQDLDSHDQQSSQSNGEGSDHVVLCGLTDAISSAVVDGDIDMSDHISRLDNSAFEEMLSTAESDV
ncbi:hypothetical protein N7489_011670 [Penicillium chrysogenum]|uniref:uncharacterized protein n=1 Tax=Penicillium chrysogenum TaxID=5076 RepID=UPI0024DF129B|nr:uncharacterized protein N7489_011670 [Penicillium chrysogenum]KAJ5230962.1 hypothetical protein N7489_011670 [Penicillium chrysogenum]